MTQDQFDAEQAYNARQEAYREEVLEFVHPIYAEEIADAMGIGATVFCAITDIGTPGMVLATTCVVSLVPVIEKALAVSEGHFYVIDSEHTKGYYVL